MKVGLFFGSFNPIHTGHLILAHTICEEAGLDKLWFVVSPQNPFKEKSSLLHEFDRFDLVQKAVEGDDRFDVIDIEFHMPKPSYTVDTLVRLKETFPDYDFSLIMGEDNLTSFHKWKNYEMLLEMASILYYPRETKRLVKDIVLDSGRITKIDAAFMQISSTYIRDKVKANKSIRYLVPAAVEKMINEKGFYLR
jgi:nicotinate-nucleotide adenylyltransferase